MNITTTTVSFVSDLHLNTTQNYSNDHDLNNRVMHVERDCDMDCILDRYRESRASIVRPLTLFLSLIGIIGIIGNTLVIFVFSRTVQKRTSTYLVLMLAIIDLIACSIVIPGTLFKEWMFEVKSDLICKLWELMKNFAIISSAMTLAAIAFDRFLLVYRRQQDRNKKHLTVTMIIVTVVFSTAMGVPPMMGVGVYIETSNGELINIKVCMPNDQYISAVGLFLYWQIVTGLFGVLILTIIVLYTLIFAMVYRHSARISSNSANQSSTRGQTFSQSKTQKQGVSVLPFMGLPKSNQQTTFKVNINKVQRPTFLPITLLKMKNILNRSRHKEVNADNEVIAIKVIQSSASSESSLSQVDEQGFGARKKASDFAMQGTSKCGVTSKTAWERLKQGNQGRLSSKRSTLTTIHKSQEQISQKALQSTFKSPSQNTTASSTNQNQLQQMRNRSAHIKTTQVLCIITTVYIISFLPMFLITHQVIGRNVIIFYLYFINNAANPIIYSFMNRKFRQDICKMFMCKSSRIWTG